MTDFFVLIFKFLFFFCFPYSGKQNIYSKTKINIQDRATFQVKQKIQEKKYPVTFDVVITTPKDSHELDMSLLNDPCIKSAEKEMQALDAILQVSSYLDHIF